VRDQGRTDLTNLVFLCSYHHHLVHEGDAQPGQDDDDHRAADGDQAADRQAS
jgi:hypothetical protein